MEKIDQLTMELLTNKKHYNKMLSVNNPEKYEKQMEFLNKKEKYNQQIIEMTGELLSSQNKIFTNDIYDAFENYLNKCFRYLEMKEIENDENEDILFPTITDEKYNLSRRSINTLGSLPYKMTNHNNYNIQEQTGENNRSYWGKQINKLHYLGEYDDNNQKSNNSVI